MTKSRTFANVWDALEDSPEDAATMTMRSNVMIAITDKVRSWSTTQAQAARRLGITQPRLNDLLHGKINKFSLDTLTTLATHTGSRSRSTFARPPEVAELHRKFATGRLACLAGAPGCFHLVDRFVGGSRTDLLTR